MPFRNWQSRQRRLRIPPPRRALRLRRLGAAAGTGLLILGASDHAAAAPTEDCDDPAAAAAARPPGPAVSRTSDISHEARLAALVEQLLDWIEANTAYDVSASRKKPPAIRTCHSGDVISYEGHLLIVDARLAAAYDIRQKAIYLVEPWSPDDARDVGRLLHELIHDVQTRTREWACWGDAEWAAYKLQAKWLRAQGVDPGFDWMQIFVHTRCRPDIHPK